MQPALTSAPSNDVFALPFEILPAQNDTVLIGDPTIGQLRLPRQGSLTLAELMEYRTRAADIEADPDLSPSEKDSQFRVAQVTVLFKSRLNPEWTVLKTKGEWPVMVEGEIRRIRPSEVLIRLICEFFLNELNTWEPTKYSACIQTALIDEARDLAIAHAKEKKLCVVTNDTYEAQATFFLFERHLVPKDGHPHWRVIEDFCEPRGFEKAEEVGGKK